MLAYVRTLKHIVFSPEKCIFCTIRMFPYFYGCIARLDLLLDGDPPHALGRDVEEELRVVPDVGARGAGGVGRRGGDAQR